MVVKVYIFLTQKPKTFLIDVVTLRQENLLNYLFDEQQNTSYIEDKRKFSSGLILSYLKGGVIDYFGCFYMGFILGVLIFITCLIDNNHIFSNMSFPCLHFTTDHVFRNSYFFVVI